MDKETIRLELFHKCKSSVHDVETDETGHPEDVAFRCEHDCREGDHIHPFEENYPCCLFCGEFDECLKKGLVCQYLKQHKLELLLLLKEEK